ncbi:MAG: hypothetical protein KIG58_00200 [Bacteroidales bacterium]|nr:hypothetical protein [Bacteroidales bacterium]
MVVAATMSASDSNFVAAKKNGFACSGRGDYDLPRLILIFVAAKQNGFVCSDRGGYDLPRPILFFVAAKQNGFPGADVAATIFRVRF